MRGRLKADLIARALGEGEPGEAVSLDPELRGLAELASMLSIVSRVEQDPSPEAQARMWERVEECQRRISHERAHRERDPARRVRAAEPWRSSYAAVAVAAVLAAIMVISSVILTGPGVLSVPPTLGLKEAEAWVFATSDVDVRPPGGEWSRQSPPFVMGAGSSIRTPEGVRAEVAFGSRNLARMDSGSEMDVMAVADNGISLQLRQGRGYLRAEGVPLRVFGGGLRAEARGTLLDLDLRGSDPVLLALAEEVAVEVLQGGTGSAVVSEGRMLALPDLLGEGGAAGLVEDIPAEMLLDEWLQWNRALDQGRGWDVGVLSEVEAGNVESPEIADMPREDGQQPGPTPQDGENGENGENGEDGEDGEDGKVINPTLSLQGTVQKEGAALSWEIRNGTTQEFILLRAAGREPAYPGDILARLAGGARSYLDTQVEPGMTYSYRVAVRHDGGMIYSNAVKLSIPEVKPEITLYGRVIDGGGGRPVIELTWHVKGDPRAEFYALVRSQTNQNPQYPPSAGMLEWRFAPGSSDYKYIDNDLYMGYTYNYRVYAVRGGSAVLLSNMVSVYVDTSVLQKAGSIKSEGQAHLVDYHPAGV